MSRPCPLCFGPTRSTVSPDYVVCPSCGPRKVSRRPDHATSGESCTPAPTAEPVTPETPTSAPSATSRYSPRQSAKARSSDPETSHAAAASIDRLKISASQRAVLECLRVFGPMIDERLMARYQGGRSDYAWPNQSPSGIRTRRKELASAGLVWRDGYGTTASGRTAIRWAAAQ